MRKSILASAVFVILSAAGAYSAGGEIKGTVKDPSGAPVRGAFVRARNPVTKVSVSVLTNSQGQYQIQDLPAAAYELRVDALGLRTTPRTGMNVAEGQSLPVDFQLEKGVVRWSDLSDYQAKSLLPEGKGKSVLFQNCLNCHGFQSRMAGTRRDLEGWQNAVNFMLDKSTGMGFFTARRFEQHPEEAADVVSYLNSVFGIDSDLTRSPADLPGYKDVVTHFSDDGLKVIYVSYELSGGSRFAWNAAEDKDGDYWMPFYGNGNRIGRLDPKTGKVDEFPVPNVGTAAIHSAVPASDGSVWLTEQATNKIGRWDPVTQKITEYQAPRGGKHTVQVDSKGNVWTTGSPLSRFDLETQKFTEINEVPNADGIAIDKSDNVWFAQFQENGKIGRVDAKTGQVKMWLPPTGASAHPRRINIDANGIVWFGEYTGGKIGSFDPKTETFKEYLIPTASPTPYAIAIDKNNDVWFSERDMDIMGRLDQKTGKITEYPTPYPENTMRDFMTDSKGRVWWTSPANNNVGYLMLSNAK